METKELLRIKKAEYEKAAAVVTANNVHKTFTPTMFGQGRKNGGTKEHKAHRHDALERIRRISCLTPEQEGQWDFFKAGYDNKMAFIHQEEWGCLFGQIMQGVLDKVLEGNATAFSEFIASETVRVLIDVETLTIPGMGMSMMGG